MAKWIPPAERERQQRMALVAQVKPAARQALAELEASWGETVPDGWSNLIMKALNAVVRANSAIPASQQYPVAGELYNAMRAPIEARRRQQERDAARTAEAAIDTNRPKVATIRTNERIRIGEMVRCENRVLVCIARSYVPRDDEMNEDGGWYSDLAEPNEAERGSVDYQRIQATIDSDRTYEQRQQQIVEDRRQRELDAIRAEGREPTFFEELMAGTSDN